MSEFGLPLSGAFLLLMASDCSANLLVVFEMGSKGLNLNMEFKKMAGNPDRFPDRHALTEYRPSFMYINFTILNV